MVSQEELYNLILKLEDKASKKDFGKFLSYIEDKSDASKHYLFHNEILHNIVNDIFGNYGEFRARKSLKRCFLSEGCNMPEAIYELEEINNFRENYKDIIPINNEKYYAGVARFIVEFNTMHSHNIARELSSYAFCKFSTNYLQNIYDELSE